MSYLFATMAHPFKEYLMTHQRTVYRFEGPQANLDSICKKVNREVRGHRLQRLELRVSSQAHPPIHLGQARTSLMDLLRERGLNRVAVSVRPFELPLDDGLGEHQLVLIETPKPPSWWSNLARWLVHRVKGRSGRAATHRTEPGLSPAETIPATLQGARQVRPNVAPPPGPSRREVSQLIKRACLQSLRDMPVDESGHWTVQHIEVRIRSAELCQAAGPLLPSVASVFVQWMAREAQRTDLKAAPNATVTVQQLPDAASTDTSTVLVGEGDLSIEIQAAPEDKFGQAGTGMP